MSKAPPGPARDNMSAGLFMNARNWENHAGRM